jgi:hypothetical protein
LRTPTIGGGSKRATRCTRGHVIAVNLVGCLYVAQGRVAEATHILALEIARQNLGPDHPDVADLLNNLGVLHDIQRHYKKAEEPYQQALAVSEKVLSQDHPDLALYRSIHEIEAYHLKVQRGSS